MPSFSEMNISQKLVAGLLCCCGLALLVPLFSLGQYLFGIDYYKHFPLLILGGGYLAFRRWRMSPVDFVGELTPRVLFWVSLGVVLTAGVFVLPSRWMASVASFSLMVGAIRFYGGTKLWRLWFGPALLCAAAIPLPVGLGASFVVWLQQLATSTASLWLEFVNIPHNTTGVSIQTSANDYLVKEACSGINSIYAAIALGVTYGVLQRYSLWRVITLLAQLVVWVIIANAARVFLMVALKERYEIDLIESVFHEVVGGVTFMVGIVLAFSGDSIFRYIVPVPTMTESEWVDYQNQNRRITWLDREVSRTLGYSVVGSVGVIAMLTTAFLFRYEAPQGQSKSIRELVNECCIDFDGVDAGLMPKELGQWQQVGFKRVDRAEDDIFGGMVSFQWQYGHPSGRTAIIQIDGPYDNWHDLTVCYQGAGWEIANVETLENDFDNEKLAASEILLKKGILENGHSIFYCMDKTTRNVLPLRYYTANRSLNGILGRFRNIFEEQKRIEGGAIQLQMFDTKPNTISAEEREENRALFWLAVEALERALGSAEDAGAGTVAEVNRGTEA